MRGWWLRAVCSAFGGVCFSVYVSRHGNSPSAGTPVLQYSSTPVLQYSCTPVLQYKKIAATFAGGGYQLNNLNYMLMTSTSGAKVERKNI